jgi:ribosomal protein S18 acetylase RimI-like enzyme
MSTPLCSPPAPDVETGHYYSDGEKPKSMSEPPGFVIRTASGTDDDGLWRILEPVIRAGETYTLPRDMDRAAALAYWRAPAHVVFVAESDDARREILGTYYLRANQMGPGSHVANCGYMTAPWAAGRGIATALCRHSLDEARRRGFRAMQFNCVVSTNQRAVQLWQRCGFRIIGRLPGAFAHPSLGFVDAFVMFRELI